MASWLLYHALSLSYSDAKEKFSDRETSLLSRQVGRGIAAVDEAEAAAPEEQPKPARGKTPAKRKSAE